MRRWLPFPLVMLLLAAPPVASEHVPEQAGTAHVACLWRVEIVASPTPSDACRVDLCVDSIHTSGEVGLWELALRWGPAENGFSELFSRLVLYDAAGATIDWDDNYGGSPLFLSVTHRPEEARVCMEIHGPPSGFPVGVSLLKDQPVDYWFAHFYLGDP